MEGAAEFIAVYAMTAKYAGSKGSGSWDDVWAQGDNIVRAVTWQSAGGGFSVVELAEFFSRVIML